MCGIAGFISRHYSEGQLHLITRALQHRGPDAEGFYLDNTSGVGLGHRRLSIIDLSEAAHQPFYSRDGRYVMVYNGEVYNYKEIAVQYNISPRTTSDSEIIIEAFAQKGIACLNDFNGMFAIAIWDTVDKKFYLIRDRFGVKPIVCYQKDDDFVFASELKAILKLPIEKKINKTAVQNYLFLEYVPDAHCILENFYKIPKGHYLVWENGKTTIKQYYNFFEKIATRPLPHKNENEALDEFEALLSSAVRYRQISDVPIGAFLSGGTDSSLICALFQKQNTNPVNTFTIGFDVTGYDESAYAAQVAQILKTNHSETRLTEKNSIDIVENIVDYYDEPFAAPSTIPSYLVCNVARKNVTVAMSGDGGDELFMGYGHYGLYHKIKRIFRFDAGLGRHLIKSVLQQMGNRYNRASRLFDLPSENLMAHLWSEQQYMFSEKEIQKLLNANETHLSIKDNWSEIDKMALSDFEKISLFDIDQYLANNLLYKMDIASMASALEVRTPYLDYRLMEYSYNLPESLKIKNGTAKYLMKKLLERYLPNDLVYRRKWGFPAPIGKWLSGELSYLIDKWLDIQKIKQQGLFNEQEINRYIKEFRSGREFHDKRLWSLIFFQMWYAKYIEAQ
ncbi:MAG: asparagine synthase (glutamine-hydrolyzing) [Bacteroidetes bacterium]|nr:asparagine synthase (glutamine-hydrolyzing) [Bacteroidota bacterium]